MWKGIVCLLIILLCGCGQKSLAERYNNDTTKLLEYLDNHSSISEPKTYGNVCEMVIYGLSGKRYYFTTEASDDKIFLVGGEYQKKDVYFRIEAEDILCGYLIAHNVIATNKDGSFVKSALHGASNKGVISYFSVLLDEHIYIVSIEDMLVLEMEDKFDEVLAFRKEWNKQDIKITTPQKKRERQVLIEKIMNLK